MKTSQKGIDLIKSFEGCRLLAYKCPADVWTIGYGHTKGVKPGDRITVAQAEQYLKEDLTKYEKEVDKYGKYNWNQNEYDALVSFALNIGSIHQLTANGTRTKEQIANKIPEYRKASGKILAGLERRRAAERKLFLTVVEDTKLVVDGIPGPKTVTALQTWLAVPTSGVMDKPTWKALQTILNDL